MVDETLEQFLAFRRIAVVGVSRSPNKYGHKIYFDLKSKGYEVYAVNPMLDKVNGDPCYPDLASLPGPVDVVNVVVPPKRGRQVVDECLKLGIERLWFQPGAESEELLQYCRENHLKIVHNQCLMILSGPK